MMTRLLSFAAIAGLLSLATACGGGDTETASATAKAPAAETTAQPSAPAPDNADAAQADPERPALSGKEIFDKQCSYCHSADIDRPGTFQLRATRGDAYAVLEDREDLTADYVKYIVRHGLNAMPPFKPTAITDAELDELAGYLAKTE